MTWLLNLPWVRKAAGYGVSLLVVLAALWAFMRAQRRVGRQRERAAQREKALENAGVRADVDIEVDRGGDGRAALDELRDKWSRN